MLVDFHCHLDLYPHHAQVVADCERQKIFTLAVTTTPRAWPRNYELASATKHVRAALGLHPQLVKERANEIGLWREYLSNTRYVGEVGLDASPRFYASFESQKRVFETILRDCADRRGKILTIHSVRAVRTVLEMIESYLPPQRGTAVLHWFSGTRAQAQQAVRLGAYFSINAEMLRNDRHHSMLSSLPVDRILTETDGPFTKTDGRDALPTDVSGTVEGLARLLSRPSSERAEIIADNLRRILSE
jgi:TatD DNase family protein